MVRSISTGAARGEAYVTARFATHTVGSQVIVIPKGLKFEWPAVEERNYIDTLVGLPWRKKSKINKDLANAVKVLDADHYGLEKVKERILEYLAVQQRVKHMKAPILCLVGPPGVGKTTLVNMIVGREEPDEGTVDVGETTNFCYVDQTRQTLRDDFTVYDEVADGL